MTSLSILGDDELTPQAQVEVNLPNDWMVEGLCSNNPRWNTLMFSYNEADIKACGALCSGCPVRSLCYAWAIVYGEAGYWGGSTQEERADRRQFIIDDVHQLWPRLYERWASGATADVPLQSQLDSLESGERAGRRPGNYGSEGTPLPEVDSRTAAAHERARARSASGFDSPPEMTRKRRTYVANGERDALR